MSPCCSFSTIHFQISSVLSLHSLILLTLFYNQILSNTITVAQNYNYSMVCTRRTQTCSPWLKPVWAQVKVSYLMCHMKVVGLMPMLQKFLRIFKKLKMDWDGRSGWAVIIKSYGWAVDHKISVLEREVLFWFLQFF